MKHERAQLLFKIFNCPLAIAPAKMQVILHVLQPQLSIDLSGIVLIEGGPPKEYMQPVKPALEPPAGNVAVVDIMGSLVHRARGMEAESGLASYEAIGSRLKALAADPRVGGILLRIDSPGGEVAGAYDLARTVRQVSEAKPVWSLIDGMGLSAGYLIASQTQRILLGTHSSVGSVGIIMIHLDQSAADEKDGLKFTVLKRGAHKDDFNPHAPLSESARRFADSLLDREYDLFVEHVAQGRGMAEKKVRATEAAIFYDEDAIALGLADGQADYEDAVAGIGEHARTAASVSVLKGGTMADNATPELPIPVAAPLQQPNDNAPAPVTRPSAADYEEIVALCTMARKPQLAAQFIAQRKTVAEVREVLMRQETDEDQETEVISAFSGKAGVAESLIAAKPRESLAHRMKQRLGMEAR